MHFCNFFSCIGNVGELTCDELVKSGAQTVNIAADIGGYTGQLLRTDVLRSSQNFVGIGIKIVSGRGRVSQSQVGKFCKTVGVQHDVVRLDILMDKFLFLPGDIQCACHFADDLCRQSEIQNVLALEDLFESFSADQLHRKIVHPVFFADGIRLNDIGMCDFCGGARLAEKSLHIFAVVCETLLKDFECHGAVKRELTGDVDFSHAALT